MALKLMGVLLLFNFAILTLNDNWIGLMYLPTLFLVAYLDIKVEFMERKDEI